jgi:hypothetical protein
MCSNCRFNPWGFADSGFLKSVQTKTCFDGPLKKLCSRWTADQGILKNSWRSPARSGYLNSCRNRISRQKKTSLSLSKGLSATTASRWGTGKISRTLSGTIFFLLLYNYDKGEQGISHLKGQEDSIRQRMKIRLWPAGQAPMRILFWKLRMNEGWGDNSPFMEKKHRTLPVVSDSATRG